MKETMITTVGVENRTRPRSVCTIDSEGSIQGSHRTGTKSTVVYSTSTYCREKKEKKENIFYFSVHFQGSRCSSIQPGWESIPYGQQLPFQFLSNEQDPLRVIWVIYNPLRPVSRCNLSHLDRKGGRDPPASSLSRRKKGSVYVEARTKWNHP